MPGPDEVTRYQPDHRGTGELMRGSEMQGAVYLAAFHAIPYAQQISPDAPPYGEGYISSFEVRRAEPEKIAGTRRATVHLVNESGHATIVELGTSKQRGHHVLSRTADMISGII